MQYSNTEKTPVTKKRQEGAYLLVPDRRVIPVFSLVQASDIT